MHQKPQSTDPPSGPRGDHHSESDFLAAQAAAAQAAIAQTWARLQDDLKNSADIPAWTRKYPWPTIGIAVAAGFLGATALKHATKPATADKGDLADALREAMADPQRRAGVIPEAPVRPSLWSTLLTEVIRALAGALQGAMATAFSPRPFSQPGDQAPGPSTNGASAATDPPRAAS